MRRNFRLSLFLLLVLATLALPAGLVSAQERVVEIGSLDLTVGGEASVDLTAHNSADPIGAWTIDVTYDPNLLTVVECAPPEPGICNPQFGSDTIRVTGASASGFVGDVTLATITFRCETEGESSLTLLLSVFGNAIGFLAPAETRDGTITCAAEPEPTSTELPQLPATGTGGVGSPGGNVEWLKAALAATSFATLFALRRRHSR